MNHPLWILIEIGLGSCSRWFEYMKFRFFGKKNKTNAYVFTIDILLEKVERVQVECLLVNYYAHISKYRDNKSTKMLGKKAVHSKSG